MAGALAGVKVLELATMVAAPSCGGILADWGAEVIKVETPAGDPVRHQYLPMTQDSPPFELDNRGKRGIVLDLKRAASRAVMDRLLERADVFLTNLRPRALEALGLDYDSVHGRLLRLVYCQVTGYGRRGAERDRPAYDVGSYWCRTGLAHQLTAPGSPPPIQRAGVGDHPTGVSAAAGVCAALFARERTGKGQLVDVSLVRTGAYAIGWDLMVKMRMPAFQDEPFLRSKSLVPLNNVYRTRDGRWIWLLMFEMERHREAFLKAVGLWEREKDGPTFEPYNEKDIGEGFTLTQYAFDRIERAVAILDDVFAGKTLDEWRGILSEHGIWHEVVQTREEFLADPVARDTGAVARHPESGAGVLATPVELEDMDRANLFRPAPALGQHTREVLEELALEADELRAVLREIGADGAPADAP